MTSFYLNIFKTIFLVFSLFSVVNSSVLKEINYVDNNKYNLTTEKDLKDSLKTFAIDSLFNSVELQTFYGVDSIKIAYKIFLQDSKKENGAVFISSGRTECMIKYDEVIYDLYKNGFSVYILDHRGQGFSGRMTKNPQMGFVNDFQDYIDDFKTFYNLSTKNNNHQKKFILAHSMGGAIAVTYLQQFPDDFAKASFSSPMLGLSFFVEQIINFLHDENTIKYALGSGDYKEKSFEKNEYSNCEIRYKRFIESNQKYPQTVLGGATYHWVYHSCKQFDTMFDNIEKIKIPILLFSGEEETIVKKSSHKKFITKGKNLGKDFTGYFLKNSKHETLIEKDEVKNSVLTKSIDFFLENP